VTVLALGWSMVHSVLYLRVAALEHDDQPRRAAELGILFCIVATISGSMWAKAMWGSYWNWDPRETSIFFLLLIYGAYLALRSAVDGEERRARLAAIYSAAAFVAVPFLMFVVPRIYDSLHPSDPATRAEGSMDPRIRTVFLAMLVGSRRCSRGCCRCGARFARVERRRLEPSPAGEGEGDRERESGGDGGLAADVGRDLLLSAAARAPHQGPGEIMNLKVLIAAVLLVAAAAIGRHQLPAIGDAVHLVPRGAALAGAWCR
jgi:hypothetical protein